MNQVAEGIWIGSSRSVHLPTLQAAGVTAILNVAADLQDHLGWGQGFYLSHAGLWDGPGNSLAAYYSAVYQLMHLRSIGHKVLVHCHEGRSRSPFVTLCYLRAMSRRPRDLILAEMKLHRPVIDINPVHLERYLIMEPQLDLMLNLGA